MSSEALATVKGIESLVFEGKSRRSDISKVLQGATVSRTIDGASTLTLDIYDDERKLLKEGAFDERITLRVDAYRFELVQVRKSGHGLTVVFEDLPVAALRRHKSPLKVAPNTTSHIDFAERLVREEPWLKFWTPPELRTGERTKVEIARGQPSGETEEEDSWAALGRIAEERGWRRFLLDNETLAYVPETYLIAQDATFTLRENHNGVENIDFDFDMGKPVATVSLVVRASRWAVPVGTVVELKDLGPASGKWLVSSLTRSLFSLQMDVVLMKARPVLPEPEAAAVAVASSAVGSGAFSSGTPSVGPAQLSWPNDPTNLVKIGQGGHRLAAPAAESFARVQAAFGRAIPVTDSYRSTSIQRLQYINDPSRFAAPGSSAHGEGRAVDVNLQALGIYPRGEPNEWLRDESGSGYRNLAAAFNAEGWCNYQIKNGSAKGRTREPWHWAYQVCK